MTLTITSLILRRKGSLPSLESVVLLTKETRSSAKDFIHPPKQDHRTSTTTRDEVRCGSSKRFSGGYVKNVVNINLVVATIIASITFAAAIQVPGGYDGTTGLANLRNKTSFKFFIAYDALAFGFSAASMFIHYLASFHSGFVQDMQLYPISSVMILTYASIASSVLAFVMATKSVLESKSSQVEFPFSFDNLGLAGIVASSAFCIPICFFLVRSLSAIIHRTI